MASDTAVTPLLEEEPIRCSPSCTLADNFQEKALEASKVQRKLIIALVLAIIFMVVEVVGGYYANSLAILTDAAHLLSDVSGFAVAIFAGVVAAKKSSSTHTFGYHRIEVLGALASVLSTWLVTGILVVEAIDRIRNPVPVDGRLMFCLAVAGVLINVLLFVILGKEGHSHAGHSHAGHDHGHGAHAHAHDHGAGHMHGAKGHSHQHGAHSHGAGEDGHHSHGAGCEGGDSHGHAHGAEGDVEAAHGAEAAAPAAKAEKNINLRGAWLHVVGDLVQSLGVAFAGALIWWKQGDPRWALADPICTFLFALLVLLTTRAILRDISDVLMERVPRAHDSAAVEAALLQVPGVDRVRDLHIWGLKPGVALLSAHLIIAGGADPCAALSGATAACAGLGIQHSTLQLAHANGTPCCDPLPAPGAPR